VCVCVCVCVCVSVCVCVYLDDVSEAWVFTLLVLDELQSLRLLAAQLRRLFLKLVSGCVFKLETHTHTHTHTHVNIPTAPSRNSFHITKRKEAADIVPLTLASITSPMS